MSTISKLINDSIAATISGNKNLVTETEISLKDVPSIPDPQKKPGILDDVKDTGSKAAKAVGKAASEAAEYIKDNPGLSAATAAGLAAGVGGLAAIRKMRKMQKSMEEAKSKPKTDKK